jgi:hypothetical protein
MHPEKCSKHVSRKFFKKKKIEEAKKLKKRDRTYHIFVV